MATNCTSTNGQFACALRAHHSGTHIYTWNGFPRRGEWADGDINVIDTDLHQY